MITGKGNICSAHYQWHIAIFPAKRILDSQKNIIKGKKIFSYAFSWGNRKNVWPFFTKMNSKQIHKCFFVLSRCEHFGFLGLFGPFSHIFLPTLLWASMWTNFLVGFLEILNSLWWSFAHFWLFSDHFWAFLTSLPHGFWADS